MRQILLLLSTLSFACCETLHDAPFQLPYYKIENGSSFHPELKYPTVLRCVLPEKITKRNDTTSSSKTWRIYWSKLSWDAYFFENGEAVMGWEYDKENGEHNLHYFEESVLPVLLFGLWIFFAACSSLLIFPFVSMVAFRVGFLFWNLATNRFIVRMLRFIIIKHAKFQRRNILAVFQDAGKKPPIFRYRLPHFVREDPYETIPQEMEGEEEEWLSDEEELTMDDEMGKSSGTFAPTPEFTVDYPPVIEKSQGVSDHLFSYLVKVKQFGMFGVWTEGVGHIDLKEVFKSNSKPPTFGEEENA